MYRSIYVSILIICLLTVSIAGTENPFFFNQQAFQAQQQLIFGTQAVAGFNTGFNNGFNFGFNNGATNGFNLGFANGNVNGFNFGLNNFANQFTNNFNNLFTNNLIQNLGTTFNNQFGKMTFNNGLAGGTPVNANSAELNIDSTNNNNPTTTTNTNPTPTTDSIPSPSSVNQGDNSSSSSHHNYGNRLSGGMLALIVIGGIMGGFLVGAAIVFSINLYARNQLTKQARASVSKQTINNNNMHNMISNSKMLTSNNNINNSSPPLPTGNISVGELKV
jgi:opacity protein-like surface antigen